MEFKELISKLQNFGKNHLSYWSNAIAGETGEFLELLYGFPIQTGKLANSIKKMERDNKNLIPEVAEELADIFIYIGLFSKMLEIDLEKAILDKIQKINERKNLPHIPFKPKDSLTERRR